MCRTALGRVSGGCKQGLDKGESAAVNMQGHAAKTRARAGARARRRGAAGEEQVLVASLCPLVNSIVYWDTRLCCFSFLVCVHTLRVVFVRAFLVRDRPLESTRSTRQTVLLPHHDLSHVIGVG